MTKLTKDDVALVERGLRLVLHEQREELLKFARAHWMRNDKVFEGDWEALRRFAAGTRFQSYLLPYCVIEKDVTDVLAKLSELSPSSPQRKVRKVAAARKGH